MPEKIDLLFLFTFQQIRVQSQGLFMRKTHDQTAPNSPQVRAIAMGTPANLPANPHYGHGRRSHIWWQFEAGDLQYPGRDRERSVLYEAGLLTESESSVLVAQWRREFERAWRPAFFYCEGPDAFFHGVVARRKLYRWADIPRALVRKWRSQRRRRSQIIRKLEEAAEHPEPAA